MSRPEFVPSSGGSVSALRRVTIYRRSQNDLFGGADLVRTRLVAEHPPKRTHGGNSSSTRP